MEKVFSSLDRSYSCRADYFEPKNAEQLMALPAEGKYSAQGAGISYVAASFGPNSKVVNLRHFARILSLDTTKQEIHVEAGVSLGSLYDYLQPKGYTLPVQPGHPQITVAGCIACNVHGKNQFREGLFADHVEEISLFHPTSGLAVVSRKQNKELFELTCGGFGLTGFIVAAKIKLKRTSGTHVNIEHIPVRSLGETIDLLQKLQSNADLLYTWNDLSHKRKFGRGFVISGRFNQKEISFASKNCFQTIRPHEQRFRPALFHKASSRCLNQAYFHYYTKMKKQLELDPFSFQFPIAEKTFYYDWYGPKGFLEQQILIPKTKLDNYISQFEKLAYDLNPLIVLASCKVFTGTQKLLHFSGTGISLTIDLPNVPKSIEFLSKLDPLNITYGAISNISKDSRIDGQTARQQYPEFESFRSQLNETDPDRLFQTELSTRLCL